MLSVLLRTLAVLSAYDKRICVDNVGLRCEKNGPMTTSSVFFRTATGSVFVLLSAEKKLSEFAATWPLVRLVLAIGAVCDRNINSCPAKLRQ